MAVHYKREEYDKLCKFKILSSKVYRSIQKSKCGEVKFFNKSTKATELGSFTVS